MKAAIATAVVAAAFLAPATAQAAPTIECTRSIETTHTCSALDRRMARQVATKVYSRLDADWNIGQARFVLLLTQRAPRVWTSLVQFKTGEGETLSANAIIRRSGGVRVTAVWQ